jgi:hypothetical protein
MNPLDASAMAGSLVVAKRIAGDVAISVVPQVVLKTNRPIVIAMGHSSVRHVIATSNITDLVRKGIVSVVV